MSISKYYMKMEGAVIKNTDINRILSDVIRKL